MKNKIVKLEIFPDYCSTAIWATYEGMDHHVNVEIDDLELKLNIIFPVWFKNKINVMQRCFDHFEPTSEKDYKKKYGVDNPNYDFDAMEHEILIDFQILFPEYRDLIDYSGANRYHG